MSTEPLSPIATPKNVKQKIPKALREQVWLHYVGKHYETKCPIVWCTNKITVNSYHVGHNIPESKGGTLDMKNLRPICSSCNLSMGDNYTIDEWNKISKPVGCGGCGCFWFYW
jgi:5-methylcytosine-specific restriction endonuclease McrA